MAHSYFLCIQNIDHLDGLGLAYFIKRLGLNQSMFLFVCLVVFCRPMYFLDHLNFFTWSTNVDCTLLVIPENQS